MGNQLKITAVATALFFGTSAYAGGGFGNTYNNPSAGAAAGAVGVGVGVGIGQGGVGGAGGHGGSSAVIGSGNSANANHNTNHNTNRNDISNRVTSTNLNNNTNLSSNTNLNTQGQLQGQQQGQVAFGGRSSASSSSISASNSGGNTFDAGDNVQSSSLRGGDVTVVGDTVTYQARRREAATAYAAPLAASNGTCMGSSSVGGQGAAFGISFGTTWRDSDCDMRYDAQALQSVGMADAAVARLCQKAEIASAMEAAGTPCPLAQSNSTASAVASTSSSTVASTSVTYTDPIIRARLGLPPLN